MGMLSLLKLEFLLQLSSKGQEDRWMDDRKRLTSNCCWSALSELLAVQGL